MSVLGLGPRLPHETCRLIDRHRAALRLQSAWRRALEWRRTSHRRGQEWPQLRRALDRVDRRALPVLERAAGVRREWTSEPRSWLTTLAAEDARATLDVIRVECLQGMWG